MHLHVKNIKSLEINLNFLVRLCQNRSSGGLVPRPVSDPDAADRLPRLQEQKRHPPTVELYSGDQHFHKF
jgi:hypothetical protein